MDTHLQRVLAGIGLAPLDREVPPPGGRIYRAVFWPSFGPYCFVTVRDFGEVGEVELVANGLDANQCRFRDLGPPDLWEERLMLPGDELDGFRAEMAEIRPEGLGDVWPDLAHTVHRDGIGFDGEVRWDGGYHQFQADDGCDLGRDHPAQGRFFLAIHRLARARLRQDWSHRALDPRHFGQLCEHEPGTERPKTRRRRS